ncbi:MAG: GH3 auxin-responsive promoter family protein [Flavobacteriia bacterium]|nr:GH3 auxin-responsive promoter family protein [Flavobacteriia bacterium]
MAFNSIFAWIIKKRIHQIDLFRKYPLEVQDEILSQLIEKGKDTEWGKKYEFSRIQSYLDFQRKIPLQDFDTLKPFIDRLLKGEENILWPSELKWFAKSSGTTSDRSKLIPVSKDALEDCHQKGGKDLLALYYDQHPEAKLYRGKHLIVGGSVEINSVTEKSFSGDLSAIIVKNLPWWAERRRTPSREIAMMHEWEAKIEKMAQSTVHEDVCIIAGVPSWTMVLLNRVLEISGKNNLKEVWPNLVLYMHGGVSFEPYRAQFKKIIPDEKMNYIETYNASEGFFGIQDQSRSNELLLMLDYGVYYEFIPMDQFQGIGSTEITNLSNVELGKNYALVISTNAGLWRYIIGDTIKFTSLFPFRFVITGRTKSYINTFGEELIVENAENAIAAACLKTRAILKEYTACPVYMDENQKGKHEWFIEFQDEPTNYDLFREVLDSKLREINSDYDAKRYKNMILEFPQIHFMKKGFFDAWLKSKGKLGGQNKIPRLQNDRKIAEELLNFEKNTFEK